MIKQYINQHINQNEKSVQNFLKMGFAETDITPSGPVETIGFGREDQISRGVLQPLSAQITVWSYEEELCCVASIDHIGFSMQSADQLRDEIGEILSVPREKVMLCFSHGHSSPNESAEPEYFQFACRQIEKAVKTAFRHMVPVKAVWGNGTVDIGLNRRKGSDVIDRRAGILKVCGADTGELKLLLLRLTAHCNVLKRDNYLISPDYFGAVRELTGAEFHCPVMVIQGAAGNIAPRYFHSATNPPDADDERFVRSVTALEDMAREVQKGISPVITVMEPREVGLLSMYSKRLSLYAEVPSSEEALRVADEALKFAGIDGSGWLEEVKRLQEQGIQEQMEQVEVQYFALGEGCLCGVANEVMTEFAQTTSEQLENEFFYFNGYTNGSSGYFPTEEEFDKGGYEVYWSMLAYYPYYGRVFPLRRASAGELAAFAAANAPHHTN